MEGLEMMRMWTARLLAAIAVCALAAGASADFQFRDEVGRFTAVFPAEPTLDKHEGQSPAGPTVHYGWEVKLENRTYAVIFTEYTRALAKNYDRNVKSMLDASQGKLLRQTKIDLGEFDGRETFTLLPDQTVMRQRIFQVGNRFYQAVYLGPFGTESRDDVEGFMQSFQILK
jgi:hypothetical protein